MVFEHFFYKEFLDKGSTATYISIIPKKEGAEDIGDFQPISLLGSTYKIISKCLISRLKIVLPSVISHTQGAFLKGRSILNGALCTNECIDTRIRDDIPEVICKIDIEKAYDHLSWGFLLDIFRRFGFGVKWCN